MDISREMSVVGNSSILSSTFKWEIENYSSYNEMKIGECICSPSFDADERSWKLVLFPSGDREEVQEFISLFILVKAAKNEIHAQYTFSLFDNNQKIIATFSPKIISSFTDKSRILGKLKFAKKSLVMSNTTVKSSNKITIVCELVIKKIESYKTILGLNSDKMQHLKTFEKLINNQQFSDVKLAVQGKEILAHKVVLAANSNVFAAMFQHKMLENEQNLVEIKDIIYNVFYELLRFLYTSECTLSEDIVSELFEVADKYQVLKLKDMCEQELCKNLSINNAIEYLQLADMHSAERLKKKAIDFIAIHGKEIFEKPEFETLDNLKLLKDVLRGIYANKIGV